jgi:hypothetical protein
LYSTALLSLRTEITITDAALCTVVLLLQAGGAFKEMSSVGLRNTMKTAADESERRAAYGGLRTIGLFVVANGFLEIVKK